ncbi:hypothetical protein, partial [Liquorilactobacillus mali]
ILNQSLYLTCTLFILGPDNKKFSNEFLAKMYTEITLASLSFALINHNDPDLLQQQTQFIDIMQRTMLANV